MKLLLRKRTSIADQDNRNLSPSRYANWSRFPPFRRTMVELVSQTRMRMRLPVIAFLCPFNASATRFGVRQYSGMAVLISPANSIKSLIFPYSRECCHVAFQTSGIAARLLTGLWRWKTNTIFKIFICVKPSLLESSLPIKEPARLHRCLRLYCCAA